MDQELKQRLIGASVIIALAVIFVPMLFDAEVATKNNQNISVAIPEVVENNLEVKKFELDKPVSEANEMPSSQAELVVENNRAQLIDKDVANFPITDEVRAQTSDIVIADVTEQQVPKQPSEKEAIRQFFSARQC